MILKIHINKMIINMIETHKLKIEIIKMIITKTIIISHQEMSIKIKITMLMESKAMNKITIKEIIIKIKLIKTIKILIKSQFKFSSNKPPNQSLLID
jgi:hypothetical protein